jgi:hypothetical protein
LCEWPSSANGARLLQWSSTARRTGTRGSYSTGALKRLLRATFITRIII